MTAPDDQAAHDPAEDMVEPHARVMALAAALVVGGEPAGQGRVLVNQAVFDRLSQALLDLYEPALLANVRSVLAGFLPVVAHETD